MLHLPRFNPKYQLIKACKEGNLDIVNNILKESLQEIPVGMIEKAFEYALLMQHTEIIRLFIYNFSTLIWQKPKRVDQKVIYALITLTTHEHADILCSILNKFPLRLGPFQLDDLLAKALALSNDELVTLLVKKILNGSPRPQSYIDALMAQILKTNCRQAFFYFINNASPSQYTLISNFFDALTKKNTELAKLLLQKMSINSLRNILNNYKTIELREEIYQAFCRCYFNNFLEIMPNMIYLEDKNNLSFLNIRLLGNFTVIYNQDGYLENLAPTSISEIQYIKGNPLCLSGESYTPIGYNIFLPNNNKPIAKTLVEIYAGTTANKRIEEAFYPDKIGYLQTCAHNEGIAFIRLNLPDLLKLNVYQGNMPESLFLEIQACIHHFFQVLTTSPQCLHESLYGSSIQFSKIFLYGASFGATMALRHAQLYPDTFDGYISENGSIHNTMMEKSDYRFRPKDKKWLDPSEPTELSKLVQPLLLIHSKDDNNVNVKVTLEFYQSLSEDQQRRTRLWIIESGNRIISKRYQDKGHSLSKEASNLFPLLESLYSFIEKSGSLLPTLNQWRGYRENIRANQFYLRATIFEKFNAKAHFMFQASSHSHLDFESEWEHEYQPLFFSIWFTDKLLREPILWKSEMDRLNELDEMAFYPGLQSQSTLFYQFSKEYYGRDNMLSHCSYMDILSYLLCHEKILAEYKARFQTLYKEPPHVQKYHLFTLYESNPNILKSRMSEFELDIDWHVDVTKAKEQFQSSIFKERTLLTHVWRELAKQARYKFKSNQCDQPEPTTLSLEDEDGTLKF